MYLPCNSGLRPGWIEALTSRYGHANPVCSAAGQHSEVDDRRRCRWTDRRFGNYREGTLQQRPLLMIRIAAVGLFTLFSCAAAAQTQPPAASPQPSVSPDRAPPAQPKAIGTQDSAEPANAEVPRLRRPGLHLNGVCREDRLRFCKTVVPGGDGRLTGCYDSHRSELSEACRNELAPLLNAYEIHAKQEEWLKTHKPVVPPPRAPDPSTQAPAPK